LSAYTIIDGLFKPRTMLETEVIGRIGQISVLPWNKSRFHYM